MIYQQGTVVFAPDYRLFGEKMAEYNAGGNTGSGIRRWLRVDPLMDKYPGWIYRNQSARRSGERICRFELVCWIEKVRNGISNNISKKEI